MYLYSCYYIVGIGTDVLSSVADATERLQQRYINSRFSSTVDEWPPYQPKHYTTLAFIHNKGKSTDTMRFSVTEELAVAGKIDKSHVYKPTDLNADMTKNISDIFLLAKASDKSFVDHYILIEGAPGIGKTVLTKEIAYLWAKKELLITKNILLLVFLRECHQKPLRSIEDLVQYVFKSSEMTTHLTRYLSKTEGKDAVIIFDGYDELSKENKTGSIIVDIINRRILTKSCLVITSRPTASSNLHSIVDRRVEIVGFTEEDRLDYILTALKNCKQVKALQHYLQSCPTINALCYIPLNMTILLCLVENGIDRLPKTQTEMYRKFIEMTIVRFIKKYENCNTIIIIDKLPHPHDKLFVELAKLAYKALKTDKIVFTLPEIKKGCPNLTMTSSNWNGLGLLKAVQYFSTEMGNQVTFHFLHFSIQEYMAAWYISTLSDSKQIKLLEKTFWEHRYYNTWIMYIGITCGSSFALRHFLSGNWFQFYSKLFKNSKVSNKYLKHKMKCLHLFQCLVEANKEGIIESVKQLFQNNQIDLSSQTLLPSDLNTLGFFLIRSVNKEWDVLNLSNCNIGHNGSNILCDRFLDKDVRSIVTIKMVNFSYNQLNFSSLIHLFDLFHSWHTSEIIITDEVVLVHTTDMKAIEDIVLQSSTLMLVFIGSYLFSKNVLSNNMLHVLSNTTKVRSIYLLNCSWKSSDSETLEFLTLLEKQKLDKVRMIGQSSDKVFIQKITSILLCNNTYVNMLVYDPTMSDQIADDISSLILSVSKDLTGVMLIASTSKLQGFINIHTLRNELSALELFNLSIYIRYLNTNVCRWKIDLQGDIHNKEIIYTFLELLYKIDYNWKLKIILQENDTLIVHKATFKSLNQPNEFIKKKSIVYLSYYHNINEFEFDIINETCSTLYILNGPDCIELLHAKLLHRQSVPTTIFIYGNIKYNLINGLVELMSYHYHNISAVLAANDVIVGLHPNTQQIALAFQLQPLTTTWILSTTDNASVFYQVIDTLTIYNTKWTELDFTGCNIGDIECEMMYRTLKYKNCFTVRSLSISFNKLSMSGIPYLVKNVLTWRVKKLNINGTNAVLYNYLIEKLISGDEHQVNSFISITYNHKIVHIIYNTSWNKIITKLNSLVFELYIVNGELQSSLISYLNTAQNLLRLCVINGTVTETILTEILKTFSSKAIEVSIRNIRIIDDDRMIRSLITNKEFYLDTKLNLVLSTNHWLCVHNATKYQLHLIHHYFLNQAAIACNVHLQELNLGGNDLQASGAIKIARSLQMMSSLTKLYLNHNDITCEAADDIAAAIACNVHLQELNLGGNDLQASGAIKIARSLQMMSSLTKLYFNHNDITCEAADDIAAAIACTVHLQELNLGGNDLQASGAIKIARSLQMMSSLTKLYLNHNDITCEAADDIAAAIACNVHLQELNLGGNDLQASGAIKIARSLQMMSSLTKLYLNHNDITCEAADDIAAAIACNVHLQELNLGGNDLQASGAIKIARSLQMMSSLTKLYLNHNDITCEAADDIAAAIACNVHLQELNLGGNDLQASGAIKIARSLQMMSSLTKLYLNHNDITCEATDDIAAAIAYNVHLQELNLGGNDLQASGAIKIARSLQMMSSLTKLYLNHNDITCEAADDIAAAIACNVHLQELNLGGNDLQASGAIKIARSLQMMSSLTKLYLNHNDITCEAADDIAAALSCNTNLQEIDMSGNNLQATGAIKIAKALQKISTLRNLYLGDNGITYKAAVHIGQIVESNTCLQQLDFSKNNFKSSGTIKITTHLHCIVTLTKLCLSNNKITFIASSCIAAAISCNSHLQEFDISANDLQASGAVNITKALQTISTLKKLYINNNNITHEAADDIAAAISCNIHLQEFDIGRNNLQAVGAIKIAKGLQNISTLTKLYINDNNITHEATDDIAAAICCNNHLQQFNIGRNNLGSLDIIKIAKSLQNTSTLKKLYVYDDDTSKEAATDIASVISCNGHLQELDISINKLCAPGTIVISKALQNISTLTKLCIDNNKITDEAADDIAAAISCNIRLQEFSIGANDLQASGAMIIAKGLQNISTLTILYINNNKITDEAADDIAAAISCNSNLKEFDIGKNCLQTFGAIKIAKGLQKNSSLTKLHIDHNNITDEAADDIVAVICCNPGLQVRFYGNKFHKATVTKIGFFTRNLIISKKVAMELRDSTSDAESDSD